MPLWIISDMELSDIHIFMHVDKNMNDAHSHKA